PCITSPDPSTFFCHNPATTETYTLSYTTLFRSSNEKAIGPTARGSPSIHTTFSPSPWRKPSLKLKATSPAPARPHPNAHRQAVSDRKSTRLNSSHRTISYAVFCLKKKNTQVHHT